MVFRVESTLKLFFKVQNLKNACYSYYLTIITIKINDTYTVLSFKKFFVYKVYTLYVGLKKEKSTWLQDTVIIYPEIEIDLIKVIANHAQFLFTCAYIILEHKV